MTVSRSDDSIAPQPPLEPLTGSALDIPRISEARAEPVTGYQSLLARSAREGGCEAPEHLPSARGGVFRREKSEAWALTTAPSSGSQNVQILSYTPGETHEHRAADERVADGYFVEVR